jgi:hypothetical protein
VNHDQADALRAAHDADARALTRMTRAQLAVLESAELRKRGFERLAGRPVSKDELVRSILDYRYPLASLNRASHVLYHAPGETWSACDFCDHQEARP